jgi:hypothetical protein
METRALACFILVPKDDPGRVAGYYTLSAATISFAKLPPNKRQTSVSPAL